MIEEMKDPKKSDGGKVWLKEGSKGEVTTNLLLVPVNHVL